MKTTTTTLESFHTHLTSNHCSLDFISIRKTHISPLHHSNHLFYIVFWCLLFKSHQLSDQIQSERFKIGDRVFQTNDNCIWMTGQNETCWKSFTQPGLQFDQVVFVASNRVEIYHQGPWKAENNILQKPAKTQLNIKCSGEFYFIISQDLLLFYYLDFTILL